MADVQSSSQPVVATATSADIPIKEKKPRKPNAWHLFVGSESKGKTGQKPDLRALGQKYRETKAASKSVSPAAVVAATESN